MDARHRADTKLKSKTKILERKKYILTFVEGWMPDTEQTRSKNRGLCPQSPPHLPPLVSKYKHTYNDKNKYIYNDKYKYTYNDKYKYICKYKFKCPSTVTTSFAHTGFHKQTPFMYREYSKKL